MSGQGGYFNPRSPHGERPEGIENGRRPCDISIHAPRTGSDLCTEILHGDKAISIHAPRTGSDGQLATELGNVEAISIHAPRTGSDLID